MRVRTWIAPLVAIVLVLAGCTDPSPQPSGAVSSAADSGAGEAGDAGEAGTAGEAGAAAEPGADWNEADRRYAPAVLADLEAARSLHDSLLAVAELPAATEDLVASLDTLLGIEITELTELVDSVPDLTPADPVTVEKAVSAIDSAESPGEAVAAYLPAVTDLYSAAIERSDEVLEAGSSERVHATASDLADGLTPDLAELRGLAKGEE